MTYGVYGLVVDSEIDLPELERVDRPCSLRVTWGPVPEPQGRWTDIWQRDDGSPWTRVQSIGGSYHIRYEGEADFLYSPRSASLTVAVHDCSAPVLRHVLLDQVLPLLLSLERLTLHASAVAFGESAIAFLGPGGSGKSTLAVLLARHGHDIVADDVLVVRSHGGVARAVPGYRGVRLCTDITRLVGSRDSEGESEPGRLKACVQDGLRFATRPLPLEHVVVLDDHPSTRPAFDALSARDTAVALLEHSYRLEQREAALVSSEVQRACGIAAAIRGWRFSYPRDAARWSDVAGAVRTHLQDAGLRPAATP